MTALRFVSALYALLAVVQVCTAASSERADRPPAGRRNSAQRDFALRAELKQLGKRLNTLELLAQESQAHSPAQVQPGRVPGGDEDEKSDSENDKLDFESQMELHIRDPRQPFTGIEGTLSEKKRRLIKRVQDYNRTGELHKVGGVLFCGPSGTGKTYFAEVLAARAGMRFLKIEAGEFDKGYAGDGAKRTSALARCAQRHAPLLVFIDEIDIAGGKRIKKNDDSAARSMNQTTSMLWRAVEIIKENPRLLCVAASNLFETADEALQDRFRTKIGFGFPSAQRLDIAARHQCSEAGYQLAPQVQWPYQSLKWRLPRALWSALLLGYCRSSYNATFRDIESLIAEAIELCDDDIRSSGTTLESASAQGAKIITQRHLDLAWQEVLADKRSKSGINEKQEERLKFSISTGLMVGTGLLSVVMAYRSLGVQKQGLVLQRAGQILQREALMVAKEGLRCQREGVRSQKESNTLAKVQTGIGLAVLAVMAKAMAG